MALIKEISRDDGVIVSYWRITRFDFDIVERRVWFVLGGYVNQAARRLGKKPALEHPVTMLVAENVEPETMTRAKLYEFAKTYESPSRAHAGLGPEFANAVDG